LGENSSVIFFRNEEREYIGTGHLKHNK